MPVVIKKTNPQGEKEVRKIGASRIESKSEIVQKRQLYDKVLLRETYIHRNLTALNGKRYSVHALAADFGLDRDSVTQISRREKWGEALAEAKKRQDDRLRDKLTDIRADILAKSQTTTLNQEVTVRMRQASIARTAQVKAAARIKAIDPEELSVREAVELLRLGMEQERRALGLPDRYELVTEDSTHDYMSTDKARAVLGRVIELAKSKRGNYEQVIESG
jgi:hypothetical protein